MTITHTTRTKAERIADAAYGITDANVRMQIAAAERRAYVNEQVEIDLYIALTFGKHHRNNPRLWTIGAAAARRVRAWRNELGE